MQQSAEQVNWLAALVAAVASTGLGALWYAPVLFGRAWIEETRLTPEQVAKSNGPGAIVCSLLLAAMAALVFAAFLGPNPAVGFAIGAGASAGLFWVAGSFGINYLFERKPLRLFLINGGYHTLQFTLYGLVLGLWH